MASTARDLVFIIRAENQATRAIKSVARDFGGLGRLKDAQNAAAEAAAKASLASEAKLSRIQQQMRTNVNALNAAEERLQKTRSSAAKLTAAANEKIITQERAMQEQLARIQTQEAKLAETRKAATYFHARGSTAQPLAGKSWEETQTILNREAANLANLQAAHAQMQQRLSLAQGVPAEIAAAEAASLAVQAERIGTLTERQKMLARSSDEVAASAKREAEEWDRLARILPLQRLSALGSMLQRIGRTARLTGVVVGAAFGIMAHSAAAFQTSTTLAATQATLPGRNTVAQTLANSRYLQKQILNMAASGRVTAPLSEQTNSAYQIFSSVVLKGNQRQQLQEGIKLLKDFNRSATANFGLVSLNDVVNAGTLLMNRFHVSVAQMPMALNRMQAAVRYGSMTMAQFTKGFGQVGPAFNAAGYSFDQMAASMTFVSKKFSSNVPMGFTGLARLTETLANPKMLDGFKRQGVAVTDLQGKLLPLDQIIGNIIEKNPELAKGGVALQNYFKNTGGATGTVQARRVFISMAQDLAGYRKDIHNVITDNHELTNSWDAMQKSPQVGWTEFTLQLKAFAIVVGTQAIPAIMHLFGWVGNVVKWFNNLSDSNKRLIGEFGVFAAVGLVVSGTILGIAGSILKLIAAVGIIRRSGGLRVAMGLGAKAGAGAIAGETAVAGGAGVGAALAAETGSVAALSAVAIPLAAVLALLILYPPAIHKFADATGGIVNDLKVLSYLLTGLAIMKLTKGFAAAAVETKLAGNMFGYAGIQTVALRGSVGLLGKSLLLLRGMFPMVLTIFIAHELLKGSAGKYFKNHHDIVSRTVGRIPILRDAFGAGATYGHEAGKAFSDAMDMHFNKHYVRTHKRLIDTSHLATSDPTLAKAAHDSFAAARQLERIKSSGLISDYDKSIAQQAYVTGDFKLLAQIGRASSLPMSSGTTQLPAKLVKQIQGDINSQFLKQLHSVGKLQLAYDKIPQGTMKSFEAFQKLNDAMVSLNAQYNGKMYQDYISQYLSQLESADKKSATKRVDTAKKAAQAAAKELSNAYSNIMSTYQSFLQQNQTNFGSLFSGPFINSPGVQARLGINNNKVGPTDVLKDLHSQLFQFNRLNSNIRQISRRGGPQSLIDQLRAAGPGALPDIEAINKMSGPQFREYVATWKRSQNAIKSATMSQLQHQIAMYRKFGSKVALAIIAGIKGEDPKLQNELERVINRMFPDLAKKAGKAPHVTPTGSKTSLVPVQHQTTHHSTTHLHVHNPVSHSVETSTKKALFAIKTRKR